MAKTPTKSKAKAKPKLDMLREAVDFIAARPGTSPAALAAELTETFKAKFRTTSEGRHYLKIGNLEAGARGGRAGAIENWANAARRTLRVAAA
ncbi:hypothetical protein KX928_23285 [Roseobacter sp. YSTF-M11]|uniref:Uncharacterized protein n=1 Tax=Roseobacter insulae TaxID=2859783 RepID=A0A9X1FZS9_9RHOB|nr:hypothetical protein [Roseobacter insulae]MBW4710724.1 hypothetical protein [Roseobacter insulae]